MKLTAQLHLMPNEGQANQILATMRAVNEAATYAAQVGFDAKVYGQVSIHHLCYKEIRERFGLPSNIAIRAIAKAVECFSRDKTICPVFTALGAVPCSDRTYRLTNVQTVSLATTAGRIKLPYIVGDYFKAMLSRKMGEADLVYRDAKFFLYITVDFDEEPPIPVKDFVGVDLGIVNILATDDAPPVPGGKIDTVRKRSARAKKTYQRRGTRSARARLRKLSRKQSRFQKDVNHCLSKKLVAKALSEGKGIGLEDLTHIHRETTVGHKYRSRHSNWSFAQLRAFIEYKAKAVGIPVVPVNPRGTSRTCAKCGYCDKANRKSQDKFLCIKCGHTDHADTNGAKNIRVAALAAYVTSRDLVAAPPQKRPSYKPSPEGDGG